jgi:DNA-binding NtrC family response regulator
MSPKMQAALLRVLQSGEVRRLGGRETLHVDVRIIVATHRDLEAMVVRGEFRQDLYFRLNVLVIRLPALRERAEDVPVLAAELMAGMLTGHAVPGFSARAMRRLVSYSWPGNVRELQNVLRRLAILGVPVLDEEHLPPELLGTGRASRPGTLRTAEEETIRNA